MPTHGEIDFQLKIESGANLVDMEYALETMSGFSGAVTIITDSVLSNNQVIGKRSSADDVRSQLMGSYLGSYVQDFKIRISDPIKIANLNALGNSVVCELISYFIHESTYTEPPTLTGQASKRLKKIEPIESKIIDRIHERVKDMHKISKMKGYSVHLKRRTLKRAFNIFETNQLTARNIFNVTDDTDIVDISAMVTRFNSFTGNGRVLLDDSNSTIPFGFSGSFSKVKASLKRIVSANLHENTGVSTEARTSIIMSVKARRNLSRDVIKYFVSNVRKP